MAVSPTFGGGGATSTHSASSGDEALIGGSGDVTPQRKLRLAGSSRSMSVGGVDRSPHGEAQSLPRSASADELNGDRSGDYVPGDGQRTVAAAALQRSGRRSKGNQVSPEGPTRNREESGSVGSEDFPWFHPPSQDVGGPHDRGGSTMFPKSPTPRYREQVDAWRRKLAGTSSPRSTASSVVEENPLIACVSSGQGHGVPCGGLLGQTFVLRRGSPLLDAVVNGFLRGVGQVVMMNNPLSGLIAFIAVSIASPPRLALLLFVGLMVATATAKLLRMPRIVTRHGLHSFNGAIVGAIAARYLRFDGDMDLLWTVLEVALFSAFSTVLNQALGNMLVPTFKLPPLHWPGVLCGLMLLLVSGPLASSEPRVITTWTSAFDATAAPEFDSWSAGDFIGAMFRGTAQAYACDNEWAGLAILLAIALFSPLSAAAALLGSLVGLCCGWGFGAPATAVWLGLWGSGASLTAVAIGGLFYAWSGRVFAMAMLAACAAAMVHAAVWSWMRPYGLPPLTLGFCLAAPVFIMVRVFRPVEIERLSTPEIHALRRRQRQQWITSLLKERLINLSKVYKAYFAVADGVADSDAANSAMLERLAVARIIRRRETFLSYKDVSRAIGRIVFPPFLMAALRQDPTMFGGRPLKPEQIAQLSARSFVSVGPNGVRAQSASDKDVLTQLRSLRSTPKQSPLRSSVFPASADDDESLQSRSPRPSFDDLTSPPSGIGDEFSPAKGAPRMQRVSTPSGEDSKSGDDAARITSDGMKADTDPSDGEYMSAGDLDTAPPVLSQAPAVSLPTLDVERAVVLDRAAQSVVATPGGGAAQTQSGGSRSGESCPTSDRGASGGDEKGSAASDGSAERFVGYTPQSSAMMARKMGYSSPEHASRRRLLARNLSASNLIRTSSGRELPPAGGMIVQPGSARSKQRQQARLTRRQLVMQTLEDVPAVSFRQMLMDEGPVDGVELLRALMPRSMATVVERRTMVELTASHPTGYAGHNWLRRSMV